MPHGAEHLEPWKWQKGKPGGPGRPKGQSITERLRELVEKADKEDEHGRTFGEVLAETAVKAAKKGDFRFWNALLDRVDGPVVKRIAVEDTKESAAKIREAIAMTEDGGDVEGTAEPDAAQ